MSVIFPPPINPMCVGIDGDRLFHFGNIILVRRLNIFRSGQARVNHNAITKRGALAGAEIVKSISSALGSNAFRPNGFAANNP